MGGKAVKHPSKSIIGRLPASVIYAAALMLLGGVGANAQTAATSAGPNSPTPKTTDELTEIVVTGTLIRGVDAPIGSELVTIDQAAILESGYTQTADVIKSLPFVYGIGAGEQTTNSSANIGTLNITHAQGINLRGLGDQATLTLLDGRRVPPGGEGAQLFDPNSIPSIALQRIEVLPDGASATYGSDAIAGVVNMIIRRDFDGAEIKVSDGFAQNYDNQVQVDAIFGHTWDGGSLMVAGEYLNHPHLLASSRPTLYNDDQTQWGGPDARLLVGAPGNITYLGKLYGLPPGSGVGLTPANFLPTVNTTSQWFDYSAIPSDERHSGVLNFSQKLADPVTLWVEGYYTDRTGRLDNGVVDQTGIEVPSTNPFYIPAAGAACGPGSPALCNSVDYAFINDFSGNTRTDTETAHQLAVGFDVDLSHQWRFKIYGTTNEDREVDYINNQINQNGLTAALALTNPATALNVFGSGGNNNPTTLAMIQSYSDQTSRYDMNLVNATIDGPVFELPGGPLRVAVGTEFHHDSLLNENWSNQASENTSIVQTTVDTENSRTVTSGFVEVQVPIFEDKNAIPGIQRLELDVAGRYDHYSDVGSTTNPKIGLRWDPTSDLSTRASWGTSFRAPNLCDTNPLCTSTVLTIPFPDLGSAKNNPPSIFPPGLSVTSIILGGNPDVIPETARTYTLGTDFHPQALKGFDVALDYYHIDYQNIIDTPAAFNPAAGSDPAYASFVIRNPTVAQVEAVYNRPLAGPQAFPPFLVNLIVDGTRHNVGEAITNGFDLAIKKLWDTEYGKFNAGLNATYVLHFYYSLVPGAPLIDQVNNVQGSGNAYPLKFTSRSQWGWSKYGFAVNGFVNFHNGYTNTAPPAPAVSQHIDAYTTVDLNVSYDTGDTPAWKGFRNITASIITMNLFDKYPPFALIGTQEFDSTTGSPLGRIVTFELRKRF